MVDIDLLYIFLSSLLQRPQFRKQVPLKEGIPREVRVRFAGALALRDSALGRPRA